MNRIETKIIIMVTNKLAAAKDSEAKTELIEELSENLYQRYQDLIADGIVEEDALAIAMDSIGDVKELLAYLKEESAEDNKGENIHESEKYDTIAGKIEKEIEPLAREIEKRVRKEIEPFAREFSKQLEKEMQADMEQEMSESKVTALSAINVDDIHTVKLEIINGEIDVTVREDLKLIDIYTESDDLEIFETQQGVLEIKQKLEKRKHLFSKIMPKEIEVHLGLPAKIWDCIELRATNGYVTVDPALNSKDLVIELVNGEMEVEVSQVKKVHLETVNGDISATVNCQLFSGSTVNGDVEVTFEKLPEGIKVSTVSGDCSLCVPQNQGFCLQYETVNGDFSTDDMSFNGIMKRRSGNVTYLDGGNSVITMSTVNGDMEISTMRG